MKKVLINIFIMILFLTMASEKIMARDYQDGNLQSLPVINYHMFDSTTKYPNVNTTPENFRAQLTLLKEHGYTTVTHKQIENYLSGKEKLPQKSFAITIDDGYESVYKVAYPVLKELGMTATLFVITSEVEKGTRLNLPMMTWAQIKEVSDSGVMDVQNHTHDMHWRYQELTGKEAMITNVTKAGISITDNQRRQIILDDVLTAKNLITKNVGIAPTAFSYPYGAYDSLVEKAIKDSGYEVAYSTITGVNHSGDGTTRIKRLSGTSLKTGYSFLNQFHSLQPTYNKVGKAWVGTINGGTVQASVWIDGEQYTSNTRMKEARVEIYKKDASGNKTFFRNLNSSTYVTPPNNVSKSVLFEDKEVGKGSFSFKFIIINKDLTREVVWKDFVIK